MNRLKELRVAKGLSQKQLAEAAGVNFRSLQRYDTGERSLEKAEAGTVLKIAKALDTTVEQILEQL